MEIQIVLELRCLDVAVSSWVFEISPIKSNEQAETNHQPPILTTSFFGRQPPHAFKSHYDDLEARNALPTVNTGSSPRSRLMSRRGSVLDLHSKLRSDLSKEEHLDIFSISMSNHLR